MNSHVGFHIRIRRTQHSLSRGVTVKLINLKFFLKENQKIDKPTCLIKRALVTFNCQTTYLFHVMPQCHIDAIYLFSTEFPIFSVNCELNLYEN